MKKHYLLMAAFASAMAFTACSNDEEPVINSGDITADDGTVIEIAVSNTGVGTTRGPRPVGSSAADNNVDRVQLKFYVDNAGTWIPVTIATGEAQATGTGTAASPTPLYLSIADDGAGDNEASINTTGLISYGDADVDEGASTTYRETKKAKIKVKGLMASVQYKIVAYGYADATNAFPYGTVKETSENSGIFTLSSNTDKQGHQLEEVFADSYLANTTEAVTIGEGPNTEVKFNVAPKLVLTRQVAGILAYFSYVPAAIDGTIVKTVEVVANNKAQNFQFPAKDLTNPDFNGTSMTSKEDVLMTFDMSKIALNYSETTIPTEGYYTFETVTNNDASTTETATNEIAKGAEPYAENYTGAEGLDLLPNTIFGARYILPYAEHVKTNTLVIRFKDTKGTTLLERNVTTNQTMTGPATQSAYDIRCNNFYSIGKKMSTDGTGGGEGDPDPDTPIDFRSDNIVLLINDAWSVLHNMQVPE